MATFPWVLVGVLYLVIPITLGLSTLRKGHFLFFLRRDLLAVPVGDRRADRAYAAGRTSMMMSSTTEHSPSSFGEAAMVGGLALKWLCREGMRAAGKPTDRRFR